MKIEKMNKKQQKGFSLIELLVVVAILGILAAAGSYAYTQYLESSRVKVHSSNVLAFGTAVQTAMTAANGGLDSPCQKDDFEGCAVKIKAQSSFTSPWGNTDYIVRGDVEHSCGGDNPATAAPDPQLIIYQLTPAAICGIVNNVPKVISMSGG